MTFSYSRGEETPAFKKINNLNLLFPLIYDSLDSRNIEYTLLAYNGCYEWQSSKPDFLQVDSETDHCQTQAKVHLASNRPYENIIWITAKDRGFLLENGFLESIN